MAIRAFFSVFISILVAGCSSSNSDYCDNTTPCTGGKVCDLPTRSCLPRKDGAVSDARSADQSLNDAGVARDATLADAAPLCDPKTCGAYRCNANNSACRTDCISQDHCIATSVCDRSEAHKTGAGVCIDPSKVFVLAAGGDLQKTIDALPAGKTHIKLAGSVYNHFILDQNKMTKAVTVAVIGGGTQPTTIDTNAAGIFVNESNSSLYLQDVKVSGATVGGGPGIRWGVAVQRGKLTMVDSSVEKNETGVLDFGSGLGLPSPRIELRRVRMLANHGYAVSLADGVLANVLVQGNGGCIVDKSCGDGSSVLSIGKNVSVSNLTVVGNTVGKVAVHCDPSTPALQNVVAQNNVTKDGLTINGNSDCSLSPQPPVCTLDSDGKNVKGSPCVDVGSGVSPGKIDLLGNPRIKGAAIDLGAYELQ
ncbi:MAG: hypothetical protein H6707_17335 [Deltaproteobacteria bacterium]|nr:hypothetical protein [Deltaproteobacteria bacterium]